MNWLRKFVESWTQVIDRIHALLQKFGCDVKQAHLQEDFQQAQRQLPTFNFQLSTTDLLLVSGGASVGEKDFTRAAAGMARL